MYPCYLPSFMFPSLGCSIFDWQTDWVTEWQTYRAEHNILALFLYSVVTTVIFLLYIKLFIHLTFYTQNLSYINIKINDGTYLCLFNFSFLYFKTACGWTLAGIVLITAVCFKFLFRFIKLTSSFNIFYMYCIINKQWGWATSFAYDPPLLLQGQSWILIANVANNKYVLR